MKQQLILVRNQIFNPHTYTFFNLTSVNAHVEFVVHGILLINILTTKKLRKNFLLNLPSARIKYSFCFSDSTAVSTHHEGGSPIPPNVDPRAYDLIMLEVDDILPSPLTPLVLALTVPKPVCERQRPALFMMAQSSPQPQSVDTVNYARVNPLPSPASSSPSSSEPHLYIDSDTSSPSVPTGPQSLSQELIQSTSQVPQPPSLFSTAYTAAPTTQPPIQPTNTTSWADEVATAEQSGQSTPETVVPNWAYSGRIRGARPRSQPLFTYRQ